ncbi:MAG: DUF2085 domain-containing protein [Methanomicrobiales archaeon]|nr:DUF2085 domain-containing protein [Methanomicrobiales archaeon]
MASRQKPPGVSTATARFTAVFAAILLVSCAAVIIAPFMAAADGGSSAAPDDPATALIYDAGDLLCHQMPERSFALAGVPMPLCQRCFAILLGMTAFAAAALFVRPPRGFFAFAGAFLPETRLPRLTIIAAALLLVVPMAIDGTLQLATAYESTPLVRAITGFLYGMAQAGFLLAAIAGADALIERWRYRKDA